MNGGFVKGNYTFTITGNFSGVETVVSTGSFTLK